LGVNPQLPDEEFTRELARYRELDEQALLAMLAQLRAERLDENTLVQTVAAADTLAEGLAGQR
jgi:hypothetical protein